MSYVRQVIKETIAPGDPEEAFYVCNADDVIGKQEKWLSSMPRVKPFFAVKSNDSPVLLSILSAIGLSFDCASIAEIDAVLRTGAPAENIIFANPCKSRAAISHARKVGVDTMTFDSVDELMKISKLFPSAKLVIRLKVDDSESKYPLSRKFGAAMDSIPGLLRLAQQLSLTVMGVSFHIGSLCESAASYGKAISDARRVFDMATDHGFVMSLLDIGGGYPGSSGVKNDELFNQIAAVVNSSIEFLFPEESKVTVISEPGRYYVESAFTLTAMIIGRRKDWDQEKREVIMNYFLNDGIYGSFSPTMFAEGEVIPVPEVGTEDESGKRRPVFASGIWGPTCDSRDVLHQRILVPEMRVGEWMTFTEMGAYTMSVGTKFNGFTMPVLRICASPSTVRLLMSTSSWPRLSRQMGLNVDDDRSLSLLPDDSLVRRVAAFTHFRE